MRVTNSRRLMSSVRPPRVSTIGSGHRIANGITDSAYRSSPRRELENFSLLLHHERIEALAVGTHPLRVAAAETAVSDRAPR